MFKARPHPYLVPFDGSFRRAESHTNPPADVADKKQLRKRLKKVVSSLADLQRTLYAHDRHSVLLVFQAMDAAGKDSTIRAVMSGINPAGCQVFSFKKPSAQELDHDFLWRTCRSLPERGRIGIFNRSYYEEVLVVRVHPEYLNAQRLPDPIDFNTFWDERYQSIRDHELHLARNGWVILKFFLNVSRDEQKKRFIARIDQPHKNWKFSPGDVAERARWPEYMTAYEDALNATSREWAPWYAVPADNKSFMRLTVAEIIAESMKDLELSYPAVGIDPARLAEIRRLLQTEN